MNRRIAVRGIFVKDGNLLCVKLNPYKASKNITNFWCTIGGGVDMGEPLIPALAREIVEETGVEPQIGNLMYVQQYFYKDVENIEFFFNILNVDDYTNIDLSKTTHGAKEIAEIGYIDTKNNTLQPEFLSEIDFSSFDGTASTIFYNYL
ncbi:MAG: NUDIX domain-containing protein [bacterium]